jgi:acetylornithine deacetylase
MKAAIAAMIYAAAALHASRVPLDGNLLLAFTADEEAGSTFGADYLVEERLVRADAAVLGEPAGIHDEWEYICLISRGNCCFRIKVRGTQMHSSISDLLPSVNASSKMAYVLRRMQKDLPSRIQYTPHPLCPQGPTLNVGVMVKGGVFYGVYPGYAEFACDLRTLPGMSQEGVRRDIEAYLNELQREDSELNVQLEFEPLPLGWIEPSEIPADHPLVVAMQNAAEQVLGASPPFGAIPGTTDAPKLQFGLGIPTIPAFGPGRLPLAHSPNECISMDSPLQAAKIYALCALNYLGVK